MSEDVTINFVARSILHNHEFSWVFLVDWIMILCLTIFVLFYFNQLLGFVITQTFCRFIQYRYGVYLKIQSVQISLLGGRVIFRNVVYIGTSQAIRIMRGSINWRYWVPKRERSAFLNQSQPKFTKHSAFHLRVHGLEWFVYNREYVYETLAKQEPATAELVREFENWQQGLSFFERKLTELLPLYMDAQQLGIVIGNDCTESLVVISAPHTEGFMDMAAASNKYDRYMTSVQAKFHHPEIELHNNPDYQVSSITPEREYRSNTFARNRYNKWMNRLKSRAEREPNKPWLGLKRYMDAAAAGGAGASTSGGRGGGGRGGGTDEDSILGSVIERPEKSFFDRNGIRRRGGDGDVEESIPPSPPPPRQPLKRNSPQFLSQLASLPVEYAKVSQLLSCDVLEVLISVDVVGKATESEESISKEESSEGNSEKLREDSDPIFDIQLRSHNTKINYGPHAERQRQDFYAVFFPRNCTDSKLTGFTPSGTPCLNGLRMHPRATCDIEFEGETTLVVPVRESSKDEEFAEAFYNSLLQNSEGEGEFQRTYGWFEVRASSGSSVNISMPFVPDTSGFNTVFNINLRKPDVRSSVNHDTMLFAKNHNVVIDLHQPLKWNGTNVMSLRHGSSELEFYVLREHVTLISDMTSDFSAGPEVQYALFCPTIYVADWEIANFAMFMNVNKGNIINKPTSVNENTFLVLRAPELSMHWDLPRELIASPTTTVNTILQAPLVELELSAPNWHTLHGFLDWQRMARVDDFKVVVQHHLSTLSATRRDADGQLNNDLSRFVDTQVIDVSGKKFAILAHGFLIEYIMRVRENYFGHAYHFQTTEEFLRKNQQNPSQSEPKNAKDEFELNRSVLDTDTQMKISVEQGCFLLPTRLYSCRDCISLHFMQLNADLRFTNYYMDFQLEITPLTGRLIQGLNPGTVHEEALGAGFANADMSITQLEVHAHRMFGLPPSEPTYVVRWDFEIGDITMDFPLDFVLAMRDAGKAFGHSFDDDENKPVLAPEELHDVTFVSLNVASVDATIRPTRRQNGIHPNGGHPNGVHPNGVHPTGARFQVCTSSIRMRINDMANDRYSAKRTINIPFIGIKGFSADNQLALDASTSVYITTFINKPKSREFYEKQQEHIALHDCLFHRAQFLLDTKRRREYDEIDDSEALTPCIPLRKFHPPLTRKTLNYLDNQFAALDERWDKSDDSSQNSSLASIASDSDSESTTSSESSASSSVGGGGDSEYWQDPRQSIPKRAKYARARNDEGSPEVFPFAQSTTSASREHLKHEKADFKLNPTQWHPGAPSLAEDDDDDDVENMSVIVQILPVKVQMSPQVVPLVESFDTEIFKVDFEAQLDALQIQIVKSLLEEGRTKEAVRTHLITPLISIDFSETLSSSDGVRVEIKDVDAMLKKADATRGANVKFSSLAVLLRHGSQNVTDVRKLNAVSILLSKFSLWWQETSQEDGIGALNLDSLDLSVDAENVEWSIHYLGQLMNAIMFPRAAVRRASEPSIDTHAADGGSGGKSKSGAKKQDRLKATFYALTMAGERMGVEQDSYVLSRPSGAVQSETHVRSKLGWRLVMRLRYLLQRLPPAERHEMEQQIAEGTFDLPENSKEQMLDIYRKWRSWEQSKNLADTEIFKFVFDDKTFQEYVLGLSTRFLVNVESMVARILYPNIDEHFAGIDALQMQLGSTQMNDTQSLSLVFQCSKARARGSIELILVVATIISALNKLETEKTKMEQCMNSQSQSQSQAQPQPPVPASAAASSSATAASAAAGAKAQPSTRALQASISVFMLDIILEFDLSTLRVETQNHQLQFTSTVELMETATTSSLFHTGTLVTSDGAFRVYRQPTTAADTLGNKDILDTLVQDVQLGYAGRGVAPQGNTWVTLDVNTVSVAIHPTALQLADILVEFLKTDLPKICGMVDELQRVVAPTDGVSPIYEHQDLEEQQQPRKDSFATALEDPPAKPKAGVYINARLRSAKVRAKMIEDLRLVFQGKEMLLKVRKTEAVVGSIDLSRCTLGLHFGDGSAAVANTQFESVRSIMRYDVELNALAIYNTAALIKLETMSLVWILEFAKNRHLDLHLEKFMARLDKAFELFKQVSDENLSAAPPPESPVSPSSASTTAAAAATAKSKFRLRLMNKVREISIRLPLDTSSFKLTVLGAKLNFENFETFQELEGTTNVPDTVGAGIEDLKLELMTARKPVREMVRVKFNVSFHQEQGKTLFNVTSEYIRFALDPEAVGSIFVAIEKLKQNSRDMFPSKLPQQTTAAAPAPQAEALPPTPTDTKDSGNSFRDFENTRVKMLFQYLTVTWYTSSDSTTGVVLGFDKFQVLVAKLVAQVELAGAYITPVNPVTLPMKDRINTLYSPLISAHAFLSRNSEDAAPWVQGEVLGKSITLKFTPSVAMWALDLADSFTNTSNSLQVLAQRYRTDQYEREQKQREQEQEQEQQQQQQEQEPGSKSSTDDWNLNKLPFNVRINMHFDQGQLKLMEEKSDSRSAALELHSPSLDVALEFKTNQLLLRLDASQTSNKIYPKAISEIKAMSVMIGRSFRMRAEHRAGSDSLASPTSPSSPIFSSTRFPSITNPSSSGAAEPPRAPSFLENLELDIRFHLGSQELYLSCLPYGKVGALLSTQGIDFLITAPQSKADEPAYLTCHGLMKKTRISLQHMYSREVSSSIEFAQLIVLVMHKTHDSFKVGVNLNNPRLQIDLSKLHDMRMFFDIWSLFAISSMTAPNDDEEAQDTSKLPVPQATRIRRRYSTSSSAARPKLTISPVTPDTETKSSSSKQGGGSNTEPKLIDRYKRAMSSVPFAFLVNFTVSKLSVVLGMGPSIGDATIFAERSWLVALHSSNVSQMVNFGVDSVSAHMNGRLGGVVKLDGIMAKMAMQWKENQEYPLIHVKFRVKNVGFYFSLDFHPFIAANIRDLALVLTTQDQLSSNQEDRMHIAITCEAISLVLTALVVAHSFDVISLFKRLQSQISSLPIFMPEVAQETAERTARKDRERQQRIMSHLIRGFGSEGMQALIDIRFGEFLVHTFPTEFVDVLALKVLAKRVEVHYDRKRERTDSHVGLDFAIDTCVVGLASVKGGGYDKTLTDLDYEGFLKYVSGSTLSSTIIHTPEVTVLMDTWQKTEDLNTVYYTFSNEVHGSIEVGWNYGSINFIKEMINAHKDAWAVRQDVHEASIISSEDGTTASAAQAYREATANLERKGTLLSQSSRRDSLSSRSFKDDTNEASVGTSVGASGDGDVMTLMGVKFIAKKSPVISIPQLRDLGDATPPIEWLGVNRQRLPLFLYYFITRKISFAADEIEGVYSQLMGMLDEQ